jgi:hypothetical protein
LGIDVHTSCILLGYRVVRNYPDIVFSKVISAEAFFSQQNDVGTGVGREDWSCWIAYGRFDRGSQATDTITLEKSQFPESSHHIRVVTQRIRA